MKWISAHLEALLILLLAGFVIAWLAHDHHPGDTGKTVEASSSTEVKHAPKIGIAIKSPVKVYAGGAGLKSKIELPPEVVQDDRQQVISSSKIEGDQPHTITTVIDTDTGESRTFVRDDPLPWLAWEDHGGIGIYTGIRNGSPAIRLQAHQGIFRIKAVNVGVVASLDQLLKGPVSMDYFVGVGAEYRW
ncbi:MAG: hypothetical protein HY849_00210 [Nitrosomonadales bacterium]|nr:hypothetical protein [Nitrosomonadales bacterium]